MFNHPANPEPGSDGVARPADAHVITRLPSAIRALPRRSRSGFANHTHELIGTPANAIRAASPTASLSVGWPWVQRAMSSALP